MKPFAKQWHKCTILIFKNKGSHNDIEFIASCIFYALIMQFGMKGMM